MLVPSYVVVNKGDGPRYQKVFYEGLIAARIKGTFMLQISLEGRKKGRKELLS